MGDDPLGRARELLGAAERAVVLTGAGVSAESGVPTFRGSGGLWKRFRPEDLATPEAFARDPRLVWEWYEWRRGLIRGCAPNPAHRAIASWMARGPGVTLVTQNVDDLHERAGREAGPDLDAAPRLLKLHGSIVHARCTRCAHRSRLDEAVDATSEATLPRCPACRSPLRPDVVWFGETLPETVLGAAFEAAARCDVCLVVGTTGAVYPAAAVAHEARSSGAPLIVVDPGPTEYDAVADTRVNAPAGAVLPLIL